MKEKEEYYFRSLFERYPALKTLKPEIVEAYGILATCYEAGNKLILAGNGGSCADAEHMAGELMKGFKLKRAYGENMAEKLISIDEDVGPLLAENLENGLPAISLASHPALNTAYMNDRNTQFIYAQQLGVLGKAGDVFLAISTSGNSENIYAAAVVAKAKEMKVIALTGKSGGKLNKVSDVSIIVPSQETYMIQELHLPIYHTMCLMLEEHFFGE